MKKDFFDYIIERMADNPNIWFISAGLGWPRTDELQEKYPDRYVQTEASEQTAMDIAVGLAYAGKTPVVYTITPFLLRAFETIRTYVAHEGLPIKLIGVGRDNEYSKTDGYSHEAADIPELMGALSIPVYFPHSIASMRLMVRDMLQHKGPAFISIPK